MVRSTRILEIIEEDHLLSNAAITGNFLQERLSKIAERNKIITNVRGRGLMVAFDLPSKSIRDKFVSDGMNENVMFLGCGERTIRFRPALMINEEHIEKGLEVMEKIIAAK
jgi:L-lysine 6-transaminase